MFDNCDICGNKTSEIKKKIVAQKYITRPYRRYLTMNRWNVCDECYERIIRYVSRKVKNSE